MHIGWQTDIATCELVEKTLGELISEVFCTIDPSEAEKDYIKNTALTITQGTQRPCII